MRRQEDVGFGAFEKLGTDLALLQHKEEEQESTTLREIKSLAMKIYRSTNMRYQIIAKLILRNKADELREQVQMNFCFEMPQHMSLVLMKLDVQSGAK
jgi:hypothetical protein